MEIPFSEFEQAAYGNEHGLYQANVVINGVRKKAFSTFFPREWSPQQVVNAVNSAARSGKRSGNDRVIGSYQGIKIVINYKQGKIASAYPIMEEKETLVPMTFALMATRRIP